MSRAVFAAGAFRAPQPLPAEWGCPPCLLPQGTQGWGRFQGLLIAPPTLLQLPRHSLWLPAASQHCSSLPHPLPTAGCGKGQAGRRASPPGCRGVQRGSVGSWWEVMTSHPDQPGLPGAEESRASCSRAVPMPWQAAVPRGRAPRWGPADPTPLPLTGRRAHDHLG